MLTELNPTQILEYYGLNQPVNASPLGDVVSTIVNTGLSISTVITKVLFTITKFILNTAFNIFCFTCTIVMSFMFDLAELTASFVKHLIKFIKFSLKRMLLSTPAEALHGRKELAETPQAHRPKLLPRISLSMRKKIGAALVVICLASLVGAAYPFLGLEFNYALVSAKQNFIDSVASHAIIPLPTPSPDSFQNALRDNNGIPIIPVNTDFALIIPKIGINAPVIPGVNPTEPQGYEDALQKGVAHANTSFYPSENGTVYLFSHSTNYEWFVKDLNAVFYLLKNLRENDAVVIMYLGNRYTYRIRETRVVNNKEVAYLSPQAGKRNLILQTCWPPGTAWKRLLIFADLVDEQAATGFGTIM